MPDELDPTPDMTDASEGFAKPEDDPFYDPDIARANASDTQARPDGKGGSVTAAIEADDTTEDEGNDEHGDLEDDADSTTTEAAAKPAAETTDELAAQRKELDDQQAAQARAEAESKTLAEYEAAAADEIATAMGFTKGEDGKYSADDLASVKPFAKRVAASEHKADQAVRMVQAHQEAQRDMAAWYETHGILTAAMRDKAALGKARFGRPQLGLTDDQAKLLNAISQDVKATEASWKALGKLGKDNYTRERAIRLAEDKFTGTGTAVGVMQHAPGPRPQRSQQQRRRANDDPNAEAHAEAKRQLERLRAAG